jgi:epoxyqueuosine reductase
VKWRNKSSINSGWRKRECPLKTAIKTRALELGFDDCRFTTASPPDHAAHFQKWLASGAQGQMGYLERNAHKRIDPSQVLADAKTIISLLVSYEMRSTAGFSSSIASGQIARYARFNDYHDVMGERLKALSEFVNSASGPTARSLWYVDTGPILERDLAQRAGLGFVGKHTNLISRKFGNWVLLSEIITTVKLEPDATEKNRCGSCSRCIEACPTAAITAPFHLDARRCISYLTIELKGSIPEELRPAIGNRIFGCDDCLAACPWNRFAREGAMMRPHYRADLAAADMVELLNLDDAGFKKRFAGTPIVRAKRRGLLRNVCVALGNAGDRRALPALEKAATDPEPLIAEHARWAINQITPTSPEASQSASQ